MIFKYNNQQAIFIHVPKTGGSYIQKFFQKNNISLDKFVVIREEHDLIDRFGVIGKFTDKKHQSFLEYCRKDPKFLNYKCFISVRKPFERMVSFYFSPHRWVKYNINTGKHYSPKNVVFNEEDFIEIVKRENPAWQHISLSQDYLPPKKLIILRHESLDKDLQDNFKGFKFLSRRINTSLYSDLAELVIKNKRLREIVESDPGHRKDLDIFY